jgi:hypothetical protein
MTSGIWINFDETGLTQLRTKKGNLTVSKDRNAEERVKIKQRLPSMAEVDNSQWSHSNSDSSHVATADENQYVAMPPGEYIPPPSCY